MRARRQWAYVTLMGSAEWLCVRSGFPAAVRFPICHSGIEMTPWHTGKRGGLVASGVRWVAVGRPGIPESPRGPGRVALAAGGHHRVVGPEALPAAGVPGKCTGQAQGTYGRLAAVTTFPDPVDLYPDVAGVGSLAAALQAVAVQRGLSLGEVRANVEEPLRYASVASETPLRDALGVSAGHVERYWSITGWGQGIALVGGRTEDLGEVATAARAWREGVPLREIQQSVPFVVLTRRGEVAEQGPAQVVAAEWQSLREGAETADWPEYRALIDAAFAEPKLRQLYPYTSHWSLRFSTTTGFRFSPDVVCLEAFPSGKFVVKASWNGVVLAEVATADEAVSLAVRHLPADVGPAVAGAYRD